MAVAPAAARPRPGGGRLFIIVGVLLAALAFGGVFLLGNVGGGGALGGPTNTVVIAKQSIPLRHQITAADLELAKASVNGDASLANVYTSTTDVVNKIAQINISKGAMINSDMLAVDPNVVPTAAAPAFLPLAKGYVAMTIPTSEQQGVAGHISVGDYITVISSVSVTVFATSGQQTGPAKQVTKTVFTNLRIIGLGPASAGVTSAAGNGNTTTQGNGAAVTGVTSSLTVELTQCNAEYLTWFLANTNVRYTLESYKDYAPQPPQDNDDPACLNINAAGGVSNKQVDAKYHFSTL